MMTSSSSSSATVSFQGERGAYSESAAVQFFGSNITTTPCITFEDAVKNTTEDRTEYTILPVENSIEGSVGRSYDLLYNTRLNVIGEIYHKIEHCLIGTGEFADIDTIYSHPQALGQCSEFIEKNHIKTIPSYDTAGSVKIIKNIGKSSNACIASRRASEIYSVPILKIGIADNSNNYTRFLILSKDDHHHHHHHHTSITSKDKTSLIFSIKHEPGSLFQIIKKFHDNGINLTKIESRPTSMSNWEYNFYIDFIGHKSSPHIAKMLDNIRQQALFIKVLGSYPASGPEITSNDNTNTY